MMEPFDIVFARGCGKSTQQVVFLELFILKDIIENHPNRRAVHIAKNSKKYRARKKNINKILNDSY